MQNKTKSFMLFLAQAFIQAPVQASGVVFEFL